MNNMIDIPIGKAIIAVYSTHQCKEECKDEDYECTIDCCKGCDMRIEKLQGRLDNETCGCLCCNPTERRDGKSVIFKLTEYPGRCN